MNILVIGDLHLKQQLGYADYISDMRNAEKTEVFDYIVKESNDCDKVVFMGDSLNGRNNHSEVIRMFVELLERFVGKKIYIVAGNHEKFGDGKTAIDFIKEIRNPLWKVITSKPLVEKKGGLIFCPYFSKTELGVKTNEDGVKIVIKKIKECSSDIKVKKILFAHYAITDCNTVSGTNTNIFNEVVLPYKEITKHFDLTMAGHIHAPQEKKGLFVTGSVFNNEVGETQKYIYKIDTKTLEVKKFELPGRGIYKVENPTEKDLLKIKKNNIVKVIFTNKELEETIPAIKEKLRRFDAFIILEKFPNTRKKIHFDDGMLEFDVEKLLEIYAKQKKVDVSKLSKAFNLIK